MTLTFKHTLWVSALCAGLALPLQPVLAQANPGANGIHQVSIPAGDLTNALNQFASTLGISLQFNAALTRDRQTQGLSGSVSARQGFTQLLQGTGLRAVAKGDGIYVLQADQGVAMLPSVKVSASSLQSTTEGTDSYTTSAMSTATKLPLSIRETPQSVTIIPRNRIEDQALITPTELLRNTPGITSTATAPYRETFYSRGFTVDTYMFDGLPIAASDTRRGNLLTDMAMFDRVEVVRGSAGLAQGSGTPSAAINFVRKRPTREFQSYVQTEAGRWSHLAAEADVSGPLSETGGLRGRGVVRWQDSDSFMDVVTEDRKLAYLIGEADLTENTVLSLSAAYQENDNNNTYGGLPTAPDGSDLKLPRSTYVGNDWNYWDDSSTSVYASLDHHFDNDWRLNFSLNRIQGEEEMVRAGVVLNETGGWDQNGGKASYDHDRTSYGLYAEGPFELFGREHELVVGASYRSAEESQDTAGYWPGYTYATDIDILNWQHNAPIPEFEIDFYSGYEEEEYGAYTTARLNLTDPLKLILGLRADWFHRESMSEWNEWDGEQRVGWTSWGGEYDYDKHLTKYGGLVYDINNNYSGYISYTEIFEAQDARTRSNEFIEPIVGENYEVGIKAEYFDGALNVATAVYRLDQGNRAISVGACPFNQTVTCYEPAGLVRSEGFDVEIQGALTPNWQIGAGYTHVETTIENDSDPNLVGTDPDTDIPGDLFKLSTTYRFPGGKWRVGGNLRWQDDIEYDWTDGDYHTEQKGYVIVDFMLGHRYNQHLDFQLNITNLFDEVYYSSINAQPVIWGGNTVYGEPRNVMLTARYRF